MEKDLFKLLARDDWDRIGLDIGSRSTKGAFRKDDATVLSIMDTTEFLGRLRRTGMRSGTPLVSTGYGRKMVPSLRTVPEVRAHSLGAMKALDIGTFTLIDIGGQDFKVVRIENGAIRDFQMNDKCAAGTGRFLERMADMLGMGVSELGAFPGRRRVLESTCAVFTETEVLSMLVEGASREDIASGVMYAVYERIRPYLRMFPIDALVLTGGVSRSSGLAETLDLNLGTKVLVPESSQFMGAIGCAHVGGISLERDITKG